MGKIAEIIKYEGDNSTFIWKHPCEDFNSLTQLIVHESQEAIFFMNGQALDMFGAGRYTLETQNIPKLGRFLNRATGGETPFHCEVYFINKTVQMAIKWGTDSKIRFIEPNMGIPLEIGACGELNLEVSDSRALLLKLVGTMNGIAWSDSGAGFTKSIQNCFRPLISTAVKAHLVSSIKAQNINILEIDENLETLSEVLRKAIVPGFEEYGLTIPQLYITNVALPEDDPTGNVENCYSNAEVKVSIKNIVYAGGLIGHVDTNATVKDSYASGHVSGVSSSGFAYVGGFVASNKGTIDGCLAFGNITAQGSNETYSRNGGFVAKNDGTLIECYRSETQILVQYTTTGSAYCEDGTFDSYSDMITYAQTNWDSAIWVYELKYPRHK